MSFSQTRRARTSGKCSIQQPAPLMSLFWGHQLITEYRPITMGSIGASLEFGQSVRQQWRAAVGQAQSKAALNASCENRNVRFLYEATFSFQLVNQHGVTKAEGTAEEWTCRVLMGLSCMYSVWVGGGRSHNEAISVIRHKLLLE